VWWIDGSERLSGKARDAIEAAVKESAVAVSAISCWEIGALVAQRRLELTISAGDWIARCEAQPFLSIVPVDARIALRAAELSPVHKDPADRIIVATALIQGAALVTKDARLRAYDVTTVW
jgi:PIN domain nuclease of toxin-antitoxin system